MFRVPIHTSLARPSAAKAVLWSLGLHVGGVVAVLALEAWLVDAITPAKFGGRRVVVHVAMPTSAETAAEDVPRVETVAESSATRAESGPVAEQVHEAPAPQLAAAIASRSETGSQKHTVAKVVADFVAATDPIHRRESPPASASARTPRSERYPSVQPVNAATRPSKRQLAHRPVSSAAASVELPQSAGTDDETPPDFAGNPRPPYPREAYLAGIEGRVVLRIHVAATGYVEQVEVVRSSGYAMLDRAAWQAVRSWRGVPARRGGRPVATTQLLPVRFQLR